MTKPPAHRPPKQRAAKNKGKGDKPTPAKKKAEAKTPPSNPHPALPTLDLEGPAVERYWHFEPADTLFFRDGQPFNAGESAWVDSTFPPGGRTLQGALRTAMLHHLSAHTGAEVDFTAFARGQPCLQGRNFSAALGDAQGLGRLDLFGPYLTKQKQPLYPVPLDVVRTGTELALLRPANTPVQCDLGHIRLPHVQGKGVKSLDDRYTDAATLGRLLAGNVESATIDKLIPLFPENAKANGLADREPRIGLARDNATRRAEEGMLYSIAPVRPRRHVGLALKVTGVAAGFHPAVPRLQRLGGEGKLAGFCADATPLDKPPKPQLAADEGTVRFKLVLATPAHFGGGWLPPGFAPQQAGASGTTTWHGLLAPDLPCQIVSACIGKPLRQGGWDMANHRPRPLQALIPSGSVYFCTAGAAHLTAIAALHGSKLGADTPYGYGQIFIGTW